MRTPRRGVATRSEKPTGVRSEGPSTRTILHVLAVLGSVAAAAYFVYLSRGVLTWVGIAAFLAVAINPLVNLLQHRLRLRRAMAILLVYLMGTAVVGGAVLLFVPPLIDAGQELTKQVPDYVDQISQSRIVRDLDREYGIVDRVEKESTSALEGVAGPDTAFALATRVVNGILALISIAVICFLLSLYGPKARVWTLAQLEGERHDRVERVADRIYRVISGYVVGIFLVALTGGFAVWLFLTILGVPFALLLAFWAGFASLLPLVGATIGGLPYITVAFFQGWPIGVAAIVFLVVYQQIENNIFQPLIHRYTVQLNPLWILLAVLIGATVLGFVGALMAIPIAGIVQVCLQEWWSVYKGTKAPPPLGDELASVEHPT